MTDQTIYELPISFATRDDNNFLHYKGKYLLIVNVASACGFTSQYKQLQELQDEFAKKLVIIGCPCNDFGGQEPGTIAEIADFCSRDFGVSFPLTQKLSITNQPHPLYHWLSRRANQNAMQDEVKWNFHKFLVNPEGELIGSFSSSVSPVSEEIIELIK